MTTTDLPTVAVLGLGIIGLPVARRLADKGYPVRVWNRTAKLSAQQIHKQATLCATPSEAVEGARFIIIVLSTGPVVDQVLFEPDASGRSPYDVLNPGQQVIVMSSIPVDTAQRQAERLAQHNVRYLDAPFSGGELGAITGSLSIMVGGDEEDFTVATELFTVLGRATYVGPAGSGQLAKLANQLIVGVTIAAVAEALILAEAGGADPAAVREAMLGGFADSNILKQHGERMIKRSFKPGGQATIQLKDLTTAAALAEKLGCKLSFLDLCKEKYETMCEHGMGGLDHSALFLELERTA